MRRHELSDEDWEPWCVDGSSVRASRAAAYPFSAPSRMPDTK